MGIGVQLETAIDTLLSSFVTTKSAAVCAMLTPVAMSGITVYIMVMGWAIMRGEAADPLHTFLWKAFRIGAVVGVALSAGEYQSVAIQFMEGVQGAFIGALSGVGTVGALVDNMAAPFETLGQALWSEAVTGFMPNFSLLFAAGLVAIAEAALFIVGLGFYLLAKVALALVFAVGPAFIFCALFPATQKFTESWIGQVLHYVFLNVLVAASIAMLTDFASQFASHVAGNVDTLNIIKATTALLICSCALVVVMLNLNQLASALSGGVSIGGIGQAAFRALTSRRMPKEPKPTPAPASGGEVKPTSGNNPGTGPDPMYLRKVLDNLKRAA